MGLGLGVGFRVGLGLGLGLANPIAELVKAYASRTVWIQKGEEPEPHETSGFRKETGEAHVEALRELGDFAIGCRRHMC